MNFVIALSVQCIVLLVFLGTVINFRRFIVSKTAELTLAVDAAVAKLQAPVTPDSEVQVQIDRLNAAMTPPTQ